MTGNTISHAHNVSKRRWNINLRPVHAKIGAPPSACASARPACAAAKWSKLKNR
jgi:large subunit ribosomal protein L28